MKQKPVGFIVIYDDEGALECLYGRDPECEGAIEYSHEPILFPDRQSARRAIRISIANAKLRAEQGLPVNEDFTTEIKFVQIRAVFAPASSGSTEKKE